MYYPSSWRSYDIATLEEKEPGEREKSFKIQSKDGRSHLDVISVPLADGNILQIGTSSAQRQHLLSRFRTIYLITLAPIVAFSFSGGILFSTRMLKPVNRLISLTRGIIETGNMDKRIDVSGHGDELDELTDLFNRMLERIERLIERMRISLDSVAHDLRTPMTRLRQKLETASAAGDGETKAAAELSAALDEVDGIRKMPSTLMDISEAESGVMKLDKVTTDLSALVTDLAEFYGYLAEDKGVTLRCNAPEPLDVDLDVNRFRQVVTNLLDNAVKYTPEGGEIEISVFPAGMAGNGDPISTSAPGAATGTSSVISGGSPVAAILKVKDSGIGIPAKDIPHIWDRLFRGDKSRSAPGLGLGLGLVKAIVEAHGGKVKATSRVGSGSEFTITLPVR
jgi:signal transduction histidine kinase